MIKGIIFDLDGTLLDSMYIWDSLGEVYLSSVGIVPQNGLKEILRPLSLYQSACYLKKEYSLPFSVNKIIDDINKMVEDYYIKEVQLKPGVKEFLDKLKQRNIKCCIATLTDRYQVEMALKRCCINEYFVNIITSTEVGHGKDEPFIYREALKSLKCKKTEALVFEDAVFAAKTAKDDGFNVVGIYDIHEKNNQEFMSLADFYLTNYYDTETFFEFVSQYK